MKKLFALSSRWHLCGWILFGAIGFGAGWFLKPVESGRDLASNGKIPVRREGAAAPAGSTSSNSRTPSTIVARQSIGVKSRYMPEGGREPVTLLERLRFTFADSRGRMQEVQFSQVISEMTAADGPAIRDMLNEIARDHSVTMQRNALYMTWGELDPGAASAAIREDFPRYGQEARSTACHILEGWAAKDMPAALAVVNEETDENLRNGLFTSLIITFAGQDLAKCTQWAFTQDRADLLNIGRGLGWAAAGSYGIESGIPWYRDLPNDGPGGLKEAAWIGLSYVAQQAGGQAMVDLITSSSDLPWCKPEHVRSGLKAASARGITAGLDFLSALPPAGLQKVAGRLDTVFHETSFAEAGTWLKSKQASPAYDFLASEYANRLRSHDPNAAIAWAATISDSTLRSKAGGAQ